MLKSEFETMTDSEEISNRDYEAVENVYMYHPAVDDIKGREQIVYLYKEFGMTVIKDMEKRALQYKYTLNCINEHEKTIQALKQSLKELEC